jgi:hypothetical protein
LRVAHSDSNSDCHSNGDSNRYPHPDAYAMHGEMYTDTEASPNPAPASNTAFQVVRR